MPYEFIEHTADIKFIVTAKTLENLFMESANALKESISGKTKISEKKEKTISIEGTDYENLLYQFLEEFLFLIDSEEFLLSKVTFISINEKKPLKLNATFTGDNSEKYKNLKDVKAITYNSMYVKKQENKWKAQVVLDI